MMTQHIVDMTSDLEGQVSGLVTYDNSNGMEVEILNVPFTSGSHR